MKVFTIYWRAAWLCISKERALRAFTENAAKKQSGRIQLKKNTT
jgi:hypothetical protein